MKAAVLTAVDAPFELRDVPDAAPQDGEELVHVRAAGINFLDILTIGAKGMVQAVVVVTAPLELRRARGGDKVDARSARLVSEEEKVRRADFSFVNDGPLSALKHLVGLLANDSHNPPLAAGEIVTTGTLTRAYPVTRGETWTTTLHDLPLDGIEIRFV